MTMREKGNIERESNILKFLHVCFTLACLVVVGKMLYFQLVFKDSDPNLKYFKARSRKVELTPVRGSILASDGRLLAISTPMYQIYMDCTVRKAEFKALQKNKKKISKQDESKDTGKVKETDKKASITTEEEWRNEAGLLARGLSAIYGNTASYWSSLILKGRDNGNKYLKIGGTIDHETLQKIKSLPLFNLGANKGGIIVERTDTRQYPYGSLARRVIGYVKDNSRSNGNNAIGLEGKFDYILHGSDGYGWTKKSDKSQVENRDSTWVEAKDGMDVRTTLDIDIQDIADDALRRNIIDQPNLEGGCVIVMDVKTGAIRAMVNLLRDSSGNTLNESYNMAIGRAGEPGSVFKSATLMSLIEDGKVNLSDEIPTNHGRIGLFTPDDHIVSYERQTHKNTMTVMHGYEISSNYIFRKLAIDNYGNKPKKFLDNLYLYKFGESFDFDLNGLASTHIPSPDNKAEWSGTSLGSIAIGYSVSVTPLHIITFYNAIANKGRMMKPYLVEDIEKDGIVKEKKGPAVLNGSICSRQTADSLTKGLMQITSEGTAALRLKNAKLKVAGKTGTARIAVSASNSGKGRSSYTGNDGLVKYQATFVGFFPAEQPRYSAIVVAYSKPSREIFYGGTTPAMVLREIVDKIYALDNSYGEEISSGGRMPDMSPEAPATSRNGKVPGLKGLGLMDAIYAIENDGYKCSYSGVGHVVSQSPAAGTTLGEGQTITIRLE